MGHRAWGKGDGVIDDFRLTIDYCISTQRTEDRGQRKGRRQQTEDRSQRLENRGDGAIDDFRLTIDYCI